MHHHDDSHRDHHAHGADCDCGHDHHAHGTGCGCGHHHHHAHSDDCGCGHEHIEIPLQEDMTILQLNVLLALYERKYLPVAQFAMTSSKEAELYVVALAPVYLGSAEDSMEDVKVIGAELLSLERGGLITLDYDLPINGYPYEEYRDAALYCFFAETVEEGAQQLSSLFDTPNLELGSMALTEQGVERVEAVIAQVQG